MNAYIRANLHMEKKDVKLSHLNNETTCNSVFNKDEQMTDKT